MKEKDVVLAAGEVLGIRDFPSPPTASYLFIGDPWTQGPMLIVLQQLHSLSETSLQGREKGR